MNWRRLVYLYTCTLDYSVYYECRVHDISAKACYPPRRVGRGSPCSQICLESYNIGNIVSINAEDIRCLTLRNERIRVLCHPVSLFNSLITTLSVPWEVWKNLLLRHQRRVYSNPQSQRIGKHATRACRQKPNAPTHARAPAASGQGFLASMSTQPS